MKKPVAVAIPIYKPKPSQVERAVLIQGRKILGKHPAFFYLPESLDPSEYLKDFPEAQLVRFEDRFFNGIAGYNRLMLSAGFYEAFSAFEHVLIYQLDAWVFQDRLLEFCSLPYDYWGAPWLHPWKLPNVYVLRNTFRYSPVAALTSLLTGRASRSVGNGGFTLRRVDAHLRALRSPEGARAASLWRGNEDHFWCLAVPRFDSNYRLPSAQEALGFAFELHPRFCFRKNAGKLPFGCHAWEKYDPDFWKEFISAGVPGHPR